MAGTPCGISDALSPSLLSSERAAKIPDSGVRKASPSGQVKSTKIPLPFYLMPASLPHSCPLQFILHTAARALAKPKPVTPLLGALQWFSITLRTKRQLPQPLSPCLTRSCMTWPLHVHLFLPLWPLLPPPSHISLLAAQNVPNPASLSQALCTCCSSAQNSPFPRLCPAALSSSFGTRHDVASFLAHPFD